MLDHVLGRPSTKSRRLQVLAVLSVWSAYLLRGNNHGPPLLQSLSRWLSRRLTPWQILVTTMISLYAARNASTLVGLASPEPLSNMYEPSYFRATWVLTAMDAGFWTAMKIRNKAVRDLASMVFTVFYLFQTQKADDKVRKIRSNLTVEHLRVSWNKGRTPYLSFIQSLMRPRFMRWPPREIRIPRPSTSDFKEHVHGWLYFDGHISELKHHTKMVLDIPGGGYVAMDPRCNDDRLLSWAAHLQMPILSLDYKKSPEFPYPYALNECYDVYTTLIATKGSCIGLSGETVPKIVISGDSAGGTLATSTTLMIIESGSSPVRRFQGQTELPLPEAVVLFYPGMDMNIGNWMSDEQMQLMRDRRMRGTNRRVVRRKSMQYNNLVGTPHHSDDEDEGSQSGGKKEGQNGEKVEGYFDGQENVGEDRGRQQPREKLPKLTTIDGEGDTISNSWADVASTEGARSPHPEYAHPGPSTWSKSPAPEPTQASQVATRDSKGRHPSTSHHSEPMRTRLATSSMISYFNDRILTPEMMRAMIILYIGPHNRPDFSTDYLLSPVLAPDLLLSKFPKTYFLTGERDPLVDDTVIFAGRLRRVKAAAYASGGRRLEYQDDDCLAAGFDEKDVAETVLIPGISHGFMQFPALYPSAWKWIDRSAEWILEAFEVGEKRRHRGRVRERTNGVEQSNGTQNGNGETNGGGLREGRHHHRTESSGDEGDRPLEMSMVKPKGTPLKPKAVVDLGDEDEAGANGRSSSRKRNGAAAGRGGKKADLARLASSDDLLGRRMQGIASGLTGLIEEE